MNYSNLFLGLSNSSSPASFVRPNRPAESPQSFLSALKGKYSPEQDDGKESAQIVISGKVAEEMGFDKIRRRQGDLEQMKIAVVDGQRISSAHIMGEESIAQTCPRVQSLDLSRNLFEELQPVISICKELPVSGGTRTQVNHSCPCRF